MRRAAKFVSLLLLVALALTAQQTPSVVVLDPGHGGTDAGARGSSGILEKEVALQLAQAIRVELERRGTRVVMTRQGDENPSFDDRAAVANGFANAVFLTLHVSSTGPVGSVRTYVLSAPAGVEPTESQKSAYPVGPVPWDNAQEQWVAASRRLAELLQSQFKQRFPASPGAPGRGNLRQLRSVAMPAVAVELSSVSVADRAILQQMTAQVAEVVAVTGAAYRHPPGGGN